MLGVSRFAQEMAVRYVRCCISFYAYFIWLLGVLHSSQEFRCSEGECRLFSDCNHFGLIGRGVPFAAEDPFLVVGNSTFEEWLSAVEKMGPIFPLIECYTNRQRSYGGKFAKHSILFIYKLMHGAYAKLAPSFILIVTLILTLFLLQQFKPLCYS